MKLEIVIYGILLVADSVGGAVRDTRRAAKAGEIFMKKQYIGHTVDAQTAREKADAIVVAEVIDSGTLEVGPPGQALHCNAKIKIVTRVKGNVKGSQTITFFSRNAPVAVAEQTPEPGQRFLVFLQEPSRGVFHAIKMLPATEQNLKNIGSPSKR